MLLGICRVKSYLNYGIKMKNSNGAGVTILIFVFVMLFIGYLNIGKNPDSPLETASSIETIPYINHNEEVQYSPYGDSELFYIMGSRKELNFLKKANDKRLGGNYLYLLFGKSASDNRNISIIDSITWHNVQRDSVMLYSYQFVKDSLNQVFISGIQFHKEGRIYQTITY
jgi:hypothetical protein